MANTVPERTTIEGETRESRGFSMRNDERSLAILHRISLRPGPFQTEARRAFLFLERQKPGASVAMKNSELGLDPETLEAIERAVDEERLLYGEETSERKAFREMRADVQETVREMKAQGDREYTAAMDELIPNAEKKESVLYREASEILQNVAREMGIKRPVILEITRNPEMNAFILRSEQEGGRLDDASAKPLHVYVNAGMFTNMQKAFGAKGQTFTRDHLAGILGHELQHLRQPRYNMDEPGKDAALSQRFEYDADLVAMESMDKAGYNPMALIQMMEVIQKVDGNLRGAFQHYFGGTHPLSENRVKDLLAEFHRPERVFFSADVEAQPFSASVHGEAEAWTRDRLRARLKTEDLAGFDVIIEDIENDPRATFADAEMAMQAFKIHLEIRAVLSEAAQELETGALGLRDAMLYAANAKVSGNPIRLDLWDSLVEMSPARDGRDRIPPSHALEMLGMQAAWKSDAAAHRDPQLDGSIRTDHISVLVNATFKDTFLIPEPLADGPFRSLDDLADVSNEIAPRFWGRLSTNWQPRAIPTDRKAAILALMARAFWLKREIVVHYGGDDVAIKQAVLASLEQPRTAVPETSAMSPTDWGQAIGALSRRVATIRKEVERVAVQMPDGPKEVPSMYRNMDVDPFAGLPSTCADPVPGVHATDATRERLRIQNRLLAVARHLFDRDLSQSNVQDRIGAVPADVPEVKDWLFRRATTDYLFSRDTATTFPVATVDGLDRFSVVKDYFRVVPTSLRRLRGYNLIGDTYLRDRAGVVDALTTNMTGSVIGSSQRRKLETFKPEDVGDRLRDIRTIANNALLTSAVHSGKPDHSVVDVSNAEVAALVSVHQNLEAQKRELFSKWVRGGLGHGRLLHDNAAEILGDRTRMPRSVVDPAESALGRALRVIRTAFESRNSRNIASLDAIAALNARNEDIARRFAIAATNFYAAAFADNAQEIRSLQPGEIKPI